MLNLQKYFALIITDALQMSVVLIEIETF